MSSATRLLALVELLAARGGMGLREVARQLEIPAASLHRLLGELEKEGVVERTETGMWMLSYRLLRISGTQLERLQLPELARPFLERLASQTGETTFLAIPSGEDIIYVDMVRTEMQLQLNVVLGTRRPMYCTGLGKAILANLSDEAQEAVLATDAFPALTPFTITSPLALREELESIRARGYSTDREEIIRGVHCIAVPLLNHMNRAVGAISVAGVGTKQESDGFQDLLELMLRTGKEISFRLGHQAPDNQGHQL